jgi:dihydroorotase
VQHISTAEGVELVRAAQREGLPVTAEATPHHLLLSCDDLSADDANFKMAPPLGNHEDSAELRRAVMDGVLMFATDHAPHPAEAKAGGFAAAANGIIGLETAIPITYHVMVEEEGMPVDAWARAWSALPAALFPRPLAAELAALPPTVVEIGAPRAVDCAAFATLSRNCPYQGMSFTCWPKEVTE